MLRTLIAGDSIPFRTVIKSELLSQFPSMEVIEAGNGEEVFKKMASYPIDLVFMDIGLPGQRGLELTRKMKANYKNVTIAMLTSYNSAEYREAAARCGADCFIIKDLIKMDQISTMVKCFQRAKDTVGLKPSCVRLASEGSQS